MKIIKLVYENCEKLEFSDLEPVSLKFNAKTDIASNDTINVHTNKDLETAKSLVRELYEDCAITLGSEENTLLVGMQ